MPVAPFRNQRPQCKGEEQRGNPPAQIRLGDSQPHPGAGESGQRVTGERRDESAEHDRERSPVAHGEHPREQLRLVAHFANRDDE